MTALFENPILTKELRTRMRGARAFWILFVFLGALSGILATTYFQWWRNADGDSGVASFGLGRQFYEVLFVVQAALVGLITPALTSGALSIEREQRTFEALSVTVLPRRSIVLGKLFSALAFVVLLLVATLPLTAVCFLLGGVAPQEIAAAYVLLTASSFLYGATGLAFSAFARTTTSSTVLTYGTILLFFLVTLPMALYAPRFGNTSGVVLPLTAVNPVGAMGGGTLQEVYYGVSVPAWLTALVVNGFLGVILTLVALHRLEWPRSDRSGLLRGLTAGFLGLIALLVCGSFSSKYRMNLDNAAAVLCAIPAILVPLFATGDGLPAGRLRTLLSPARLRRGEATSGLTFALLVTLGTHLLLLTGIVHVPIALSGIAQAVAVAFGLGALALVLSQKMGNRWGSLGLTLGVTLLAYLLPFGIAYPNLMSSEPASLHSVWNNALYLSPITGAVCLDTDNSVHHSLALGKTVAPALVTTALYTVFGLGMMGLLARIRRAAA